jgi:apolipoprotein N-acyltransferase
MAFHEALRSHAKGTAYLLVGAYGGEIMTDPRGELFLGQYNSAYFYRPDGTRDPQRYDKIHLVLFGEYIPFRRSFNWLYQQLKRFAPAEYNYDYSLEHGTHYTIYEMAVPIPGGDPNAPPHTSESTYRFGTIICYEDAIPYVARNFALDPKGRKRVDWLVNISNDGWFVRFLDDPPRVIPSTELPQHAAIGVFRAVENRLPILRSVNTGISCLIDSSGRIYNEPIAASDGFPAEAMQRTGMSGWFLDRMPIDSRVTFFSRHGQWLDTSCAIAFVAVLVGPAFVGLARRRARKST